MCPTFRPFTAHIYITDYNIRYPTSIIYCVFVAIVERADFYDSLEPT